ncbi:hypothetical protein EUX98_g522 [Antrodiella citrinella]|uniref:Ubiquitin-like domain-containing protein n=1 Tax=Antrodiella citrinella TaxID=2447956 RepID=A0A4S4N619_9APHY|nr:hypothetical protein EUX98_g522 [Antrodiella citrinella]
MSMDIKVELPTHSLSFQVQIPPSSTIRDVKDKIQSTCPGAPRIDGQRVIWRGRFLKDEEKVEEIWKSLVDTPVVHLSVHPSAWTTTPPLAAGQQVAATVADTIPASSMQPAAASVTTTPGSVFYPFPGLPLPAIAHHHNIALHTLMRGSRPTSVPDATSYTEARSFATSVLHAYGIRWPSVLDQEYPPFDASVEGVKYEQVYIDNTSFLSLTTPNAIPSPCQTHALSVLKTTYALLSIATPEVSMFPPPSAQAPYQVTPNTNLNHHLQQLGLPALRLAPNQPGNPNRNPADPNNALPEIRAIPLRALVVPLMMLAFRTLLLMYFFSPSKRPLFGLVLSAWILYEAWNAFRVVLGNGERPGPDRDVAGDNANDAGAGQGAAQAGAGAQAPAPGAHIVQRTSSRSLVNSLLDKFANFQLVTEELTLVGDPLNAVPTPTIIHRVKTFCVLLLTTLHPAVWDRRRAYMRRREGRMRSEANHRTADANEEDQSELAVARRHVRTMLIERHAVRPAWVKEYVERVLTTEWADDL